jgi:hypothetical protein
MSPESLKKIKLESKENCGICGQPLIYGGESVAMRCVFCGQTYNALIYCPQGHYICDTCHQREAVDILRQVLISTVSTNPIEIMEQVMSHPSVPMHGPEHHAMVPAVIVTAVRNSGYPILPEAVEKAISRGEKIPGGWCGFYGACGAAIGVGIAVSILTEATPLKGKERSLAIEATSLALSRLADGNPRCCKRSARKALETAVEFLQQRLNISLGTTTIIGCSYVHRNKECPKELCPYYLP